MELDVKEQGRTYVHFQKVMQGHGKIRKNPKVYINCKGEYKNISSPMAMKNMDCQIEVIIVTQKREHLKAMMLERIQQMITRHAYIVGRISSLTLAEQTQ